MRERKIRVGPWDCSEKLLDRVTLYRQRMGGKSWTWVLHKALEDLMERERVFLDTHAPQVGSVPPVDVSTQAAAVGLPAVVAAGVPAVGLPAVGVPAVGVPAVGLPAAVAVVELSENEKRLERLIQGRAQKQFYLEEAPRELEREPGSLRALNWLARMPGILASYDADIAACRVEIEAERALSIKKVDNGEEGGEV